MSKKITLENVDSSELPEIPVIGEVKQIRFTQDMELVSTLADSDLFMVQVGADLEARPNTITFDLIIKNLSGPIEEGSKKFVTGDMMFKVIGDMNLLDTWDNTNIVSSLNATYVNVRRIEEELRREINRSTGKDEQHDEQIANLRQDLTATNEMLNQEINRSVAKDNEHDELLAGLRDDVDSTSDKLDAEIDRSTAKDAEHDTLLKGLRVDVNANKSAIESEVARSTARDEAHDAAIAKNASDITTEVNRAKAEEAKIRQEMKTADTNLQNAITAETERATGVEEDLQQQITDLSGSTDDRLEALEALSHEQNTDTGTTSKTFVIDSGNTGAMLKAEGGGLSTRTKGDAGYANFTVQNLVIKGDVTQEGDTFITQAERVEVRDNMILINEGETGAGVTAGFAGIEVDRGTEQNFMFGFNESDGMFKIGKEGNMFDVALRQPVGEMTDGMFASWDAATKTFKTTNLIPPTLQLYFGVPEVSVKYASDNNGSLQFVTNDKSWTAYTSVGSTKFTSSENRFRFYGEVNISDGVLKCDVNSFKIQVASANNLVISGSGSTLSTPLTANSFFRSSDHAEALYATDITTLTDGMFLSWDADNKKVVTTNKLPIGKKLYIAYDHTYITEGGSDGIEFNTRDAWLRVSTGSVESRFVSSANWFLFEGNISTTGKIATTGTNLRLENKSNYLSIGNGASTMDTTLKATTFYRSSDNSEVLYQADLKSVLTGKETNYAPTVKAVSDAIDAVNTGTTESLKNYLPLAGGTMTGSITMPNSVFLKAKNVGGTAYNVISVNANNNVEVGNTSLPLMLVSSSVDIIHYRDGAGYKMWDIKNLPDPATKSGNNAFTGTNSFVGGKFSVGNFIVDISGNFGYKGHRTGEGWASECFFYNDNGSDTIALASFGAHGEITSNKINYVYINVGNSGSGNYRLSQYKFYNNKLVIPDNFSIITATGYGIVNFSRDDYPTSMIFGSSEFDTVIRSNSSDVNHLKSGKLYKIWDASNLPTPASTSDIPDVSDMARRSEANTFTANNSFTAGQFNVGPLEVESSGSILVNLSETGGWARSITWENNSDQSTKVMVGGCHNAGEAFVWMGVGDLSYGESQYRFYGTKMVVPTAWSLDDKSGNSLVWSESTQLAHLGRAMGTTKIRSGAVDLIHTKGTTDYKILDESNYSQYLPTTSKWAYGFVTTTPGGTKVDFNTVLSGPDSPKILLNYNHELGNDTNAPTDMKHGAVLQIDGNYNSSYNNVALRPQLAFDVNHNVENGTRYMWFRTANNLGYGDSSNWKRVVTADEKPAGYVLDEKSHPALKSIEDGTTLTWLRAPQSGFIPFTAVNIANGGSGSLGTSTWTFKDAYIANVSANRYLFGNTGVDFRLGTNNKIAATISGSARGIEIGDLLVSSNYGADAVKVPTNGIFASGRIQSNDSMLVGYSGNVTEGMLGYGLYYDGTFAQGLGSEYSSGALVLYKMLNPNKGKAGYNVPRAATGTPTYLKITDGTVKLGVGVNKTYTAGEAVTVTEHTLATLDAVNTKLGSYLPLTGGTVSGSLSISPVGSAGFAVNNADTSGVNVIQTFRVKGANKFLLGWSESGGGAFIQRSDNNRCMVLMSDGLYTGSALDNTVRVATLTDLGGYLPLTGGTMSGSIICTANQMLRYTHNSGTHSAISVAKDNPGYISVGNYSSGMRVFLLTNDSDVLHYVSTNKVDGVHYRMWDERNLPSPATQSWVTSQGYLKSHQTIYALTFAAGAFAAKTFTPTSAAVTVNVPTKTSHLTNDSGFLTSVPSTYATQSWVTSQGYLTSITKSMVTTALGYTPPTTNTTYSQATSSTLGLVKIGATGLASKNYAVQLNSSGQMYVAVPWTDTNTTYSAATSSTYGLVKIGATGLASKNYAVQLNSSGQMYVAVPWTDTDTNTHYTTRLYVGASGTAATAAASNPYLKVTDDNTYRNQVRFVGAGATTVASDASGNITITSTNTTYSLATSSSNGLMSSSQYTKLSNCIETVSATDTVTSVQVVDTIPASSSQVTGRLYLKFA